MKIQKILKQEEEKQKNSISLIASENITSESVRNALSSVFTNKYAEGYPGARYYSGCQYADEVESCAINYVKETFNANWANVQPHSGSQANQAVFFGLLSLGDTILSLDLKAGGHLTHGAKVSSTSSYYNIVHYTINEEGFIDMNQVEELAKKHKPKMIIAGASAYPRKWDWAKFRQIADINNSYLMADIAHIAGIVAAKEDVNPVDYADILTSTTHKTLRGPRGGLIFSKNVEIGKKVDRALFPGVQGGPMMNTIAAKAVSFEEVLSDDFKVYMKNVLKNSQILANKIKETGGKLVSGGTDNHLMILDCRPYGLNAKEAEALLENAGIFVSPSALIEDSWLNPSALRLGTPYISNILSNISEFSDMFTKCLVKKDSTELKLYVDSVLKSFYKY